MNQNTMQINPDQSINVTLTLTVEETNVILQGLRELPLKLVDVVYSKVLQQGQDQVNAQQGQDQVNAAEGSE
jgi:hypothetical protein